MRVKQVFRIGFDTEVAKIYPATQVDDRIAIDLAVMVIGFEEVGIIIGSLFRQGTQRTADKCLCGPA